ncbi:MAG: VCBS repeat-containing protein [Deltaproteobacteria bacterium]|nr:VCBS repeat-containing protein [Deltaproteobacteria bacterium]
MTSHAQGKGSLSMHKKNGWKFAAICTLSAVSLTACPPRQRTAIVVWVGTDYPIAQLDSITVTGLVLRPGGASERWLDATYGARDLTGAARTFPASLVFDPLGAVTSLDVTLTVRGTMASGLSPFETRARATFSPGAWRQLELFIPYQCTRPEVIAQCTAMGERFTCGSADPAAPCVLVERTALSTYEPDAGAPVFDAGPTPMDAGMDAGMDAEAGMDASAPDVLSEDSGPPPVFNEISPVFPRTNSRYTGSAVRLAVRPDRSCTSAQLLRVEVCAAANLMPTNECSSPIIANQVLTPATCTNVQTATLPSVGSAGMYYWRTRLVQNTSPSAVVGPAHSWRRVVIDRAGTSATSRLGTLPDFDGDGVGDLVTSTRGSDPRLYLMRGAITPRVFTEMAAPMGSLGGYGLALHFLADEGNDGFFDLLVSDVGSGPSAPSSVHRYQWDRASNALRVHSGGPLLGPAGAGMVNNFGERLASGDFNNDGFVDVLVGAEESVFLFAGSIGGLPTMGTLIPKPMGSEERFGATIAAGCDINGDGFDDAIIGAPGNEAVIGEIYVYLGSSSGLSAVPTLIRPSPTSLMVAQGGFGALVTCDGDYNADGFADVLVHSSDGNNMGTGDGAVTVLLGSATGLVTASAPVQLGPARTAASLGASLVPLHRLGMSGRDAMMVGEPGFMEGFIKIFGLNASTLTLGATLESSSSMMTGTFGLAMTNLGPLPTLSGQVVAVGDTGYLSGSGRILLLSVVGTPPMITSVGDMSPTMLQSGASFGQVIAR